MYEPPTLVQFMILLVCLAFAGAAVFLAALAISILKHGARSRFVGLSLRLNLGGPVADPELYFVELFALRDRHAGRPVRSPEEYRQRLARFHRNIACVLLVLSAFLTAAMAVAANLQKLLPR